MRLGQANQLQVVQLVDHLLEQLEIKQHIGSELFQVLQSQHPITAFKRIDLQAGHGRAMLGDQRQLLFAERCTDRKMVIDCLDEVGDPEIGVIQAIVCYSDWLSGAIADNRWLNLDHTAAQLRRLQDNAKLLVMADIQFESVQIHETKMNGIRTLEVRSGHDDQIGEIRQAGQIEEAEWIVENQFLDGQMQVAAHSESKRRLADQKSTAEGRQSVVRLVLIDNHRFRLSNDGLDGRPEGGPHLMETTFIFSDSGMRWFKRFGWQLDHSSALDQS
ncbi:hypothetical protein L1887_62312 [Cichorium endivia]|nr:hypothetical protein L1887_62312 [Cichorium endivia]